MGYKQYSDAFKRDVLVLVAEGGRSVSQLERDLEITPGLIYKWQQRYRVKEDVLQPSEERAEQAELRRLRGELEIVKQARDILKKEIQGFSRGNWEPRPLHRSTRRSLSGAADVGGVADFGQRLL
jgi:transposase-like protein